jgi:hypothetical protein
MYILATPLEELEGALWMAEEWVDARTPGIEFPRLAGGR